MIIQYLIFIPPVKQWSILCCATAIHYFLLLLFIKAMKIRDILTKLYFITWIRIPVKFVITFTAFKIGWDYSQYLTKWRRKNTQPRWCQYDMQSPTNPPIISPYPVYNNYQQYLDIKRWYRMNNDTMKLFVGDAEHQYVYADHPYRQNVNSIDQLLLRAKEYACSEHLKFYTINHYAMEEESIPQGVFREIREIHQDEVDDGNPIIPKL